MGLTTFSVSWVIGKKSNHEEVVLHIFPEEELKAWKPELERGLKLILTNLNYWHMQDLRLDVFRLSV